MQIYGPFRVSTTQSAGGAQRLQPQTAPGSGDVKRSSAPVDQLDLSGTATSVNRLDSSAIAGGGEIRIDRVAEIRRQIASGNYDSMLPWTTFWTN
jgi:negative regulator of flagellin synthesis FlgM